MKFLCVACDRAMKLDRTMTPDGGSLTVVFVCPACGRETAMLTNPMETQMVRSLGVKIGGTAGPSEPMEMVRGALASSEEESGQSTRLQGEQSGSKCPFTGVVSDAYAGHGTPNELRWTSEAEERIARVPQFARPMVKKGVEMHARERGYVEITDSVIDEVKDRFGM